MSKNKHISKEAAWEKTASWEDVRAKAEAIVANGGVEIYRDDSQEVGAYVMSGVVDGMFPVTDGGPYEVILSKRSWENKKNVGGWVQSFLCSCFVPGTLVTMDDGSLKPIEDVEAGDFVLGGDGKAHEVVRAMSRTIDENIMKIKVVGMGEEIRCTANHPFWAIEKIRCNRCESHDIYPLKCKDTHSGKTPPRWMNASELGRGMYLQLARPFYERRDIVFDMSNFCELWEDAADGYIQPIAEIHRTRNGKQANFSMKVGYQVKRFVPFNSDIAYVIGLYLGDGNLHAGNEINWSFGFHEEHLADSVIRVLAENFGVSAKKRALTNDGGKHNMWHVSAYSAPLCRFFKHYCGEYSGQKKIHGDLMHADPNILMGMFDGWNDSDARSSINRTLVSQMQLIALMNEEETIVRVTKKEQRNNSVLVPCKHTKMMYNLHWRKDAKVHTAKRIMAGDGEWVRIESVERERYRGKVYNLEVADDHTYLVHGIKVHNCTWGFYHSGRPGQGWAGRMCSHSYAVLLVANARASKDFMNDRTAAVTFNKSDFYEGTAATWVPCNPPEAEPDYVSESGSMYWYYPEGVVRGADHWGVGIGDCNWQLLGEEDCSSWSNTGEVRYGFCPWDGFEDNMDGWHSLDDSTLDVVQMGRDYGDMDGDPLEGYVYIDYDLDDGERYCELIHGGTVVYHRDCSDEDEGMLLLDDFVGYGSEDDMKTAAAWEQTSPTECSKHYDDGTRGLIYLYKDVYMVDFWPSDGSGLRTFECDDFVTAQALCDDLHMKLEVDPGYTSDYLKLYTYSLGSKKAGAGFENDNLSRFASNRSIKGKVWAAHGWASTGGPANEHERIYDNGMRGVWKMLQGYTLFDQDGNPVSWGGTGVDSEGDMKLCDMDAKSDWTIMDMYMPLRSARKGRDMVTANLDWDYIIDGCEQAVSDDGVIITIMKDQFTGNFEYTFAKDGAIFYSNGIDGTLFQSDDVAMQVAKESAEHALLDYESGAIATKSARISPKVLPEGSDGRRIIEELADELNRNCPSCDFEVKDVYFDYGQGWMWTSVIASKGGDSWQVLSPAEFSYLLETGDVMTVVSEVLGGDYGDLYAAWGDADDYMQEMWDDYSASWKAEGEQHYAPWHKGECPRCGCTMKISDEYGICYTCAEAEWNGKCRYCFEPITDGGVDGYCCEEHRMKQLSHHAGRTAQVYNYALIDQVVDRILDIKSNQFSNWQSLYDIQEDENVLNLFNQFRDMTQDDYDEACRRAWEEMSMTAGIYDGMWEEDLDGIWKRIPDWHLSCGAVPVDMGYDMGIVWEWNVMQDSGYVIDEGRAWSKEEAVAECDKVVQDYIDSVPLGLDDDDIDSIYVRLVGKRAGRNEWTKAEGGMWAIDYGDGCYGEAYEADWRGSDWFFYVGDKIMESGIEPTFEEAKAACDAEHEMPREGARSRKVAFNESEFVPSEWRNIGRNDDDDCNVYTNGQLNVYEWDNGEWSVMEDMFLDVVWFEPGGSYAEAIDNWIDQKEEGRYSVASRKMAAEHRIWDEWEDLGYGCWGKQVIDIWTPNGSSSVVQTPLFTCNVQPLDDATWEAWADGSNQFSGHGSYECNFTSPEDAMAWIDVKVRDELMMDDELNAYVAGMKTAYEYGSYDESSTWRCSEDGIEGEYTLPMMESLYDEAVDKSEYPSFSDWEWDMVRSGVFSRLSGRKTAQEEWEFDIYNTLEGWDGWAEVYENADGVWGWEVSRYTGPNTGEYYDSEFMFDDPDEAIDDLLGDKYVEANRIASSWVDEKGNGNVFVYVADDGWRAEVVDMSAFGDDWSYEVFDADGYFISDGYEDTKEDAMWWGEALVNGHGIASSDNVEISLAKRKKAYGGWEDYPYGDGEWKHYEDVYAVVTKIPEEYATGDDQWGCQIFTYGGDKVDECSRCQGEDGAKAVADERAFGKTASINKNATRQFTYAEMKELEDEIEGTELKNADRFKDGGAAYYGSL